MMSLPTHSIIIPTRDRNRNLGRCVRSINRSARVCEAKKYEIIVVDNGTPELPFPAEPHTTVIVDQSPMVVFNKPRCQNVGIDNSTGDVFSFLDADAIVGRRWMEGVQRLTDDPTLTKLCYRVRYLPMLGDDWACREDGPDFDRYETYPLAHEGYGRPEHNFPCPGPIFGNSQFSIRRDVLGDTRFNEEYAGRGFEDLWMNRELWMRNPDAYRAEIMTDAEHAMFHIQNAEPDGPDWRDMGLNRMHKNLYERSWVGKRRLPISREKRKP